MRTVGIGCARPRGHQRPTMKSTLTGVEKARRLSGGIMAKKNRRKDTGRAQSRTAVSSAARSLSANALAWSTPRHPGPNKMRVQPTRLHTVTWSDSERLAERVARSTPKRQPERQALSIPTKPKAVRLERTRKHSTLSLAPTASPDTRKSSHKAREALRCKERPDSKKAARSGNSGGNRKKFVPWC